jgi:hypothetical protein
MKALDTLGLLVSIFLVAFSLVGLGYGYLKELENYEYMILPLIIGIWGTWGAGTLLMKKKNEEQ